MTGSSRALGRLRVALVTPSDEVGVAEGLRAGLRHWGVDRVHVTETSRRSLAVHGSRFGRSPKIGPWPIRRVGDTADLLITLDPAFPLAHPKLVSFQRATSRSTLGRPGYFWDLWTAEEIAARFDAERQGYAAAHACCVATPWAAASLKSDYGVNADRVFPIGDGVASAPEVSVPPALGDLRGAESGPRFLCVGEGRPSWRRALLAGFGALHETVPNAQLIVLGWPASPDQPGASNRLLPQHADAAVRRVSGLVTGSRCLIDLTPFDPTLARGLAAAAKGVGTVSPAEGGGGDLLGPGLRTLDPEQPAEWRRLLVELCDRVTAQSWGEQARHRSVRLSWSSVATRLLQAAGVHERRHSDWEGLFDTWQSH